MTRDNEWNETRRIVYIVELFTATGPTAEKFGAKFEALRFAERMASVPSVRVVDVTEVDEIVRTRVTVIKKGGE